VNFRRAFYRQALTSPLRGMVRHRRRSAGRAGNSELPELCKSLRAQPKISGPVFIFHAASVGELETLTPILLEFSAKNKGFFIISGFSPSLARNLKKLGETLRERGVEHCLGYSPVEGEWQAFFETLPKSAAKFFLTVKYEAWPELWMELAQNQIPLVIVNASARPSLQWCARGVRVLGGSLPKFYFLTDEAHADLATQVDLRNLFPDATIEWGGDPRWDRVYAVQNADSPSKERTQKIVEKAKRSAAGAQFCFAQVWPEDRPLILEARKNFPGRIWVIPHLFDEASIRDWSEWFTQNSLAVARTRVGEFRPNEKDLIWIDEPGVLIHLYANMDAIYVGGGFGKGPHSTIEPAFSGAPICCGPHRTNRFSEISFLKNLGQLTVLSEMGQFSDWLIQNLNLLAPHSRQKVADVLGDRLGATGRIVEILEKFYP